MGYFLAGTEVLRVHFHVVGEAGAFPWMPAVNPLHCLSFKGPANKCCSFEAAFWWRGWPGRKGAAGTEWWSRESSQGYCELEKGGKKRAILLGGTSPMVTLLQRPLHGLPAAGAAQGWRLTPLVPQCRPFTPAAGAKDSGKEVELSQCGRQIRECFFNMGLFIMFSKTPNSATGANSVWHCIHPSDHLVF